MALLMVEDISKTFGMTRVLEGVSFSLDEGGILCLLGPSGCGKTTLLRILAGLEKPDTGKVVFDGRDMASLEPHRRSFGMMFQDYALFPHRDVLGNVSFGLNMQRLPRQDILKRAYEVIGLVGLSGYERRDVSSLSGGERQRVALARTLAPSPRLLLLDEPLGALDRALRERLMIDLKAILKTVSVTTVFVTHDQAEAYAMADRVAVIVNGRTEQIDPPERLYRSPASTTVARFLGLQNIIEAAAGSNGEVMTEFGMVRIPSLAAAPGDAVTLLIQPDAARLDRTELPGETETLPARGTIQNYLYRGKHYTLELATEAGTLLVFDLGDDAPELTIGQGLTLFIDPRGVSVLGQSGTG